MLWSMKKGMGLIGIKASLTHPQPPLKRGLQNDFLKETNFFVGVSESSLNLFFGFKMKSPLLRGDLGVCNYV